LTKVKKRKKKKQFQKVGALALFVMGEPFDGEVEVVYER